LYSRRKSESKAAVVELAGGFVDVDVAIEGGIEDVAVFRHG
jgi:hypothetical protein